MYYFEVIDLVLCHTLLVAFIILRAETGLMAAVDRFCPVQRSASRTVPPRSPIPPTRGRGRCAAADQERERERAQVPKRR